MNRQNIRTCPENISALDDCSVGADFDEFQTKFLTKYLTNNSNLIAPDESQVNYDFQLLLQLT